MSDVSRYDVYAKRHMERNSLALRSCCKPKRMGETTRTCPTCGTEFEPRSRNHKYCKKECKPNGR